MAGQDPQTYVLHALGSQGVLVKGLDGTARIFDRCPRRADRPAPSIGRLDHRPLSAGSTGERRGTDCGGRFGPGARSGHPPGAGGVPPGGAGALSPPAVAGPRRAAAPRRHEGRVLDG